MFATCIQSSRPPWAADGVAEKRRAASAKTPSLVDRAAMASARSTVASSWPGGIGMMISDSSTAVTMGVSTMRRIA